MRMLFVLILGLLLFGCTQNQIKTENNSTNSSNLTDCGKDFNCFLAKAETCSPNSLSYVFINNIFGVIQKTNATFQINGKNGSLCTFFIRYGDSEVKFSSELRDQLSKTFTNETIASKEAEATKKSNELLVSKEGSCDFQTNELVSMLQRWKSGSYSFGMENGKPSGDFKNALNCRGSLFEGSLVTPLPDKVDVPQADSIQKDSVVLSTEKSSYTLANSASGIRFDTNRKQIIFQAPRSSNLQFALDINATLPTNYETAQNFVVIPTAIDAQLSGTYYKLAGDSFEIKIENVTSVGNYVVATFSGTLTKVANQSNSDLEKIQVSGGKMILKRIS